MKQRTSKTQKKENLIDTIDAFYGEHGSKDRKRVRTKYRTTIMDMFRVTKILPNTVELTHLFNDEIYEPVFFDEELLINLSVGDVFLMTLGLKDAGWDIVYMSQPYS